MPVPFRGCPHEISPLSPHRSAHVRSSLRAIVRAGRTLCVSVALALAASAWTFAGSALAQTTSEPAPSVESKPAAPAEVKPAEPPARITFEPSDPWDAPEPWRTDRFYFQFAYYTWHFHYDPDHQQSYLFDSEYHFNQTWLGGQVIAGIALFQNSFGQFSQYYFGGLVWRPIEDQQPFYVKLTAGPLHGYTGQYRDKVPFNSASGWAPAIIPGVGYCVMKRYCGEFVLLGANAALFTIGVTVP
jgi:hypothetical protein